MTYKLGVFLIIFSVKERKSEKHQNQRYRATVVSHLALLTGTKLKTGVSLILKEAIFYSKPFAQENYKYFSDVNARFACQKVIGKAYAKVLN